MIADLDQIPPFGVSERSQQPVVDREEVEAGQAIQDAGIGAAAAAEGELLQREGQTDLGRLVAEAAGALDEGTGEVGLADACRASDHEVVAVLDEAAV